MNKIIAIIFPLFSISVFSSCGTNQANDQPAAPAKGPVSVETFQLKREAFTGNIQLPAELKPFEEVDIFAKVPGFVSKLEVDRGSRVKKGDLLALLDAPEILAQLSETKAKVSSAEGALLSAEAVYQTSKDSYDRLKATANTKGAVSQNELVSFQNRMTGDSASYVSAKHNLEAAKSMFLSSQRIAGYLQVRAPFDGVVTERNVHTGALVSQNDQKPLFRMESNEKLRLVIAIPESYAGKTHHGDTVLFQVNTYPGEKFVGLISRQAKSVSPQTRSEMIEADVDNQAQRLSSGGFAQASLKYYKENTFLVPSSAIVTNMQDRFVIKVVDGKAKRVSVQKGFSDGDTVEILGTLSEGDVLVQSASESIRDGDGVRVGGEKMQ